MLNHYITLKYRADTPAEHKLTFCKKFLELPSLISEILHLEIGMDELNEERSWDLILIMRFQSLETLRIYQKHPAHVALMQFNALYVKEAGAVDFQQPLK